MLTLAMLMLAAQADPALGAYQVKDAGGRTLCRFDLGNEPDVGGTVAVQARCDNALKPLHDASRWDDDGRGGFVLRDSVRKTVASATEDEAGLTLRIGVTNYALAKIDSAKMRTPAQRATGGWSVYDQGAPSDTLCTVTLAANGSVGVAKGCPTLAAFNGGRWTAADARVTLRKGKAVRAFRWGDAASLIAETGTLGMVHK